MTDEIEAPRRRVVLRRSRGGSAGSAGFSSGISTTSESLRTSAEGDEVDDAVDPSRMRDEIRRGASPPPLPMAAPAPQQDRENPRDRMNQVARAGSAAYAKEYRLELLGRLLMRKIPLDQIAQQLQVSISTVEKDRVELKRRYREAAKEMNIDEMVGGQGAFYDEVAAMAMRVAGAQGENGPPTPMRLAAMRTALAARADQTRFLATAGVFDVLRFRRAEDGNNLSDVAMLMNRTAEMMEELMREPGETPTTKPADTFQPMTFGDDDASSSTNEVQEL